MTRLHSTHEAAAADQDVVVFDNVQERFVAGAAALAQALTNTRNQHTAAVINPYDGIFFAQF